MCDHNPFSKSLYGHSGLVMKLYGWRFDQMLRRQEGTLSMQSVAGIASWQAKSGENAEDFSKMEEKAISFANI